jgi:hypothetical protein
MSIPRVVLRFVVAIAILVLPPTEGAKAAASRGQIYPSLGAFGLAVPVLQHTRHPWLQLRIRRVFRISSRSRAAAARASIAITAVTVSAIITGPTPISAGSTGPTATIGRMAITSPGIGRRRAITLRDS